jgi:hypothetical protein
MTRELELLDKVSIFEYENKTLLWIINVDYRAVELAYKDNLIRVTKEVREYIKERKVKRTCTATIYHVPDNIMKAYYSRQPLQV